MAASPFRPTHAQSMARDVLRVVGIDVPTDTAVVLTDGDDTGPHPEGHLANPGQVEYACDQFTQVTGLTVDGDALVAALPWKEV